MLTIVRFFSCMVIIISTNTNSHSPYRWFLGRKSQRNPQKVNSLIYKDYTLVEYEDGTKSYVSPEEKTQLLMEGKLKSCKMHLENKKSKENNKEFESDSDSGYEVPVAREKPKSCEDLDKSPKQEIKRNSSFPFSGGEMLPGDNGRINLPPYIVPLETSLTFPMTKQKRKDKKRKSKETGAEMTEKILESSSPDEIDTKKRFSLKDPFWAKNTKKSRDMNCESLEDAEVRKITETKGLQRFSPSFDNYNSDSETERNWETFRLSQVNDCDSKTVTKNENTEMQTETAKLEEPIELFPENQSTNSCSYNLFFPKFPSEPLKEREKRLKNKKLDPNPLKKMFGRRSRREEEKNHHPEEDEVQRRYGDAALSQILSDTESADHGSADKSSVSKLTSEKQPKKLMSGLFGSFRKGINKDKVADNDAIKNPSSFEITVKEQPEDASQIEISRAEGIVYAELDMARSPGNLMRRDDEKTEYAEIIYPGAKLPVERSSEEFKKSRENLTSSREDLTEVDEAFSTTTDGKKEAAV